MPAENLHTTHQGVKPGETVTESGIILPARVDRQSNIRETIQFDNLKGRSDTYNTQVVNFEDPYNAFAQEVTQPEAAGLDIVANPDLAAKQPRRSRTNPDTGAIENLVKYDNGNFDWVSPDQAPAREEASGETEAQPSLQEQVVESIAKGIDDLENSNEKQDQEITELKKLVEEQQAQIAALTEQLNEFVNKQQEPVEGEGANADAATAHTPKYPGQELEPYSGKSKELVPIPKTSTEIAVLESEEPTTEDGETQDEDKGNENLDQDNAEMHQKFQDAIAEARDKYAELTAKHRNGYAGHFLKDGGRLSSLLKKLPGVERAAEWINEKVDRELNEARIAYEEKVDSVQRKVIDGLIEHYGDDPEVLKEAHMIAGDIANQADTNFELKMTAARMEQSGNTNKFINWWVQQDTRFGKLKKAALIAGVGLAAGAVASLGGLPLIGLAAGAAFGAGTGIAVTRSRANGIAEKGGTRTLAEKQTQEDRAAKAAYAKAQLESGGYAKATGFFGEKIEERTAKEKEGNRNRLRAASAAGAAGAGIGNGIGGVIREGINGIDSAPEAKVAQTIDKPEVPPAPEAIPAPELQGLNFDVQPGSGYTQELMEFAQANGHALTPDQAYALHQDLMNSVFGADYININGGGNDVYLDGGDARLTMPGSATWNDGVGQFVQQWMTSRGLW